MAIEILSPREGREPAVGRCRCGAKVVLDGGFWGSSCERCDRLYNESGQELNPPSMWEEREYDDDTHTIAERFAEINRALAGSNPNHEHVWGTFRWSAFGGSFHRPCIAEPDCHFISLDGDDDEDETEDE